MNLLKREYLKTQSVAIGIDDDSYYYPKNLRSKSQVFLWNMSDAIIILMSLVLCGLIWYVTHLHFLLVIPIVLAFISIRIDDVSILTRIKEIFSFLFKNRSFKNNTKPNSSQKLMGGQYITDDGLYVTDTGRFVFWQVEPLNLSVLSPGAISILIQQMTAMLIQCPNLELIATDSARSLDENIIYLKRRIEEEDNMAVKKLLEADLKEISDKSLTANNSRKYIFALRLPNSKSQKQDNITIRKYSKTMQDFGFRVDQLLKEEIKKLISNFFDIISDNLPDFDGQQYVNEAKGDDEFDF